MLRKPCNIRVLLVSLLALLMVASGVPGCGHSSLRPDDDDDYYGDGDDDDDDDDDERPRRRKRRSSRSRRPRSNAPILIKLPRLRDAVVERSSTGKPTEDVDDLRRSLCRDAEAEIYYQLIVSKHWHYYWVCSDTKVQRAATAQGNEMLLAWVKRLKRRGAVESAGCSPGSKRRLLKQSHESGTRAKVYCDGRLVLRFADGGTVTRTFSASSGAPPAARPPAPDGRSVCPACPQCPRVQSHRVDCPTPKPCPPPRCPRCPPRKVCPACPACDCTAKVRKAGEKGFWQGVNKACKRICTLVYKKCRSINPNTALCYQVSEYCAGTCAKK